jgi:hypothetical protein
VSTQRSARRLAGELYEYDLGFFDQELGTVTSAENPFGANARNGPLWNRKSLRYALGLLATNQKSKLEAHSNLGLTSSTAFCYPSAASDPLVPPLSAIRKKSNENQNGSLRITADRH